MISSISNVKFCGDVQNTNAQDLINSPSKFSVDAQPTQLTEAPDTFESPAKKNTTAKIAGGVVAALAAVWVGLGIAVGKGGITKAVAKEGEKLNFGGKIKNVFFEIGNSAKKCWDAVFNKAEKKASDAADDIADDVAEAAAKPADNAAETAAEAK